MRGTSIARDRWPQSHSVSALRVMQRLGASLQTEWQPSWSVNALFYTNLTIGDNIIVLVPETALQFNRRVSSLPDKESR